MKKETGHLISLDKREMDEYELIADIPNIDEPVAKTVELGDIYTISSGMFYNVPNEFDNVLGNKYYISEDLMFDFDGLDFDRRFVSNAFCFSEIDGVECITSLVTKVNDKEMNTEDVAREINSFLKKCPYRDTFSFVRKEK